MEKVHCPLCEKPIFSAYFQEGMSITCPYCDKKFIVEEKMRRHTTEKKDRDEK